MPTFADHRLERSDFAVIHENPSIGAGPSIVLLQKLDDGELSDKALCWRATTSICILSQFEQDENELRARNEGLSVFS